MKESTTKTNNLKEIKDFIEHIGFKFIKKRKLYCAKCIGGKCFIDLTVLINAENAFIVDIFIDTKFDRLHLAQRFFIQNRDHLKFLIERNTRLTLI